MEAMIKSSNRQYQLGVISFVSVLFTLVLTKCISEPLWASPIATHTSSKIPLWVQPDAYARENSQTLLVASGKNVFLLGSDDPTRETHVIAFDGETGKVLWQNKSYNGGSIIALQSEIIIGGVGEVIGFNAVNGQKTWYTSLPFSRSVTHMYTEDDKILVDTVSSRYFMLETNSGKILETTDYSDDDGRIPYWREIPLGAYWQAPVYYNHYLYSRTGESYGYAFAIDLNNSAVLWKTDDNVISNISVTPFYAYTLTEDGKLLEIELMTGQQRVIVEFDAVPFNLTTTPSGGYTYSYYVAASSDERIIYVLLGDSAQLYAFQLPVP